MQVEIHDYARLLWEAHGARAIAVAAHKAQDFEKQGEIKKALTWRRVEAALLAMRGPSQG